MNDRLLSGRAEIRTAIAAVDLEPRDRDPRVHAVAHVICAMGGHIPSRDTESTGSCQYHLKQAVVAIAQADLATAEATR